MKAFKLITILAIATLISSCGKKETTPAQAEKMAPEKKETSKQTPASNTQKPAVKSSNPHINAAQSIGEKLQKNADQAKRQLEGPAPSQ